MSGQGLLVWLLVGLVAGWLSSMALGRGYGLIGDILVGIVGAYIGGYLVRALGLRVPLHGIAAMILVAFGGALVLLLTLRVIRRILG